MASTQYKTLLSGTLRDLLGQISRECQDQGGDVVTLVYYTDRESLVVPNPYLTEAQKAILTETLLPATLVAAQKMLELSKEKLV